MIPVMQTIYDFEHGDCMRACIASIFELPIEKVTNFQEDGPEYFEEKLKDWEKQYGLLSVDVACKTLEEYKALLKDCYVITNGESPRAADPEKNRHAVVWFNGEMVHDPHPDQTGIVGLPSYVTIFIVKDPSKFKDVK